jgi:hypothetical protein
MNCSESSSADNTPVLKGWITSSCIRCHTVRRRWREGVRFVVVWRVLEGRSAHSVQALRPLLNWGSTK